jgi:hypothetical protein
MCINGVVDSGWETEVASVQVGDFGDPVVGMHTDPSVLQVGHAIATCAAQKYGAQCRRSVVTRAISEGNAGEGQ